MVWCQGCKRTGGHPRQWRLDQRHRKGTSVRLVDAAGVTSEAAPVRKDLVLAVLVDPYWVPAFP
jgi:hypothetical protein